MNHSSTDLSPYLKLMSKSNLACTSFACGLQNSSNLFHNVSKVRSPSVKPHDTTKSIPSSPDHEISFLHYLLSEGVASSHSRMFSHFSFHFWNLWYNPSFTIQSILGPSMYGTNVCPSWGMDWSFLCELLIVVMLYYFCGALDNLMSGQNSTQYTLTWWSCLWCLQRVEPSTGMLQNFSAMSVDLCMKMRIAGTGSWHRRILVYAGCMPTV